MPLGDFMPRETSVKSMRIHFQNQLFNGRFGALTAKSIGELMIRKVSKIFLVARIFNYQLIMCIFLTDAPG